MGFVLLLLGAGVSVFGGYLSSKVDNRFEYACDVAEEHGRDEPTTDDEVEGLKRMIQAAIGREEATDAK